MKYLYFLLILTIYGCQDKDENLLPEQIFTGTFGNMDLNLNSASLGLSRGGLIGNDTINYGEFIQFRKSIFSSDTVVKLDLRFLDKPTLSVVESMVDLNLYNREDLPRASVQLIFGSVFSSIIDTDQNSIVIEEVSKIDTETEMPTDYPSYDEGNLLLVKGRIHLEFEEGILSGEYIMKLVELL